MDIYERVLKLLNYNQGMRGHFWYSASLEQRKLLGGPRNWVKLDSGKIVRYNLMSGEIYLKAELTDAP